jgi:hypothetical protein
MSTNIVNGSDITPKKDKPVKREELPSPSTPPSSMTNTQKWISAVVLGLIFAVISSPAMYSITSSLASEGTLYVKTGGPTMAGLLLHTVVFILIVRLIMW